MPQKVRMIMSHYLLQYFLKLSQGYRKHKMEILLKDKWNFNIK